MGGTAPPPKKNSCFFPQAFPSLCLTETKLNPMSIVQDAGKLPSLRISLPRSTPVDVCVVVQIHSVEH